MPELPEVETIRRGLQRAILGKTIKNVEVRLPKIISLGPKTVSNRREVKPGLVVKFKRLLVGKKIVEISRRAKMLLLKLEPRFSRTARYLTPSLSDIGEGERVRLRILIHLKMTGQLIFAKQGERKRIKIMNIENARILELPHKYTHLILEFADGSRLFYNDMRQFGYVRLVRDEDIPRVKELNEYGPEPLTQDFTVGHLVAKAKKRPNFTIKQFLTDPKVIAGIGNIYSDEILYWAKLRPQRKLKSLKEQDFRAIFRSIPKILRAAIKAQGSSVGDFFKVDGLEGRYGRVHCVYGRGGEKCRRCGSIIQSVKLGGRTASYCPKCQL